MTQLTQRPSSATDGDTRRARPRRWLLGLGLLVVVLVVAAWAWAGARPDLRPGSWSRVVGPAQTMANDGVSDTRYLVRLPQGGESVLQLSIRNSGRFPVTVLGAEDLQGTVLKGIAFHQLDERDGLTDHLERLTGNRRIDLDPGEEGEMWVTIGFDGCFAPGSFITADDVRLRVRQLGLTTSTHLTFNHPITLAAPTEQRPNC